MAERVAEYHLCDLREMDTDPWWEERQFDIVFADPPWWYADQRKVRKDGVSPTRGIGACHHYGLLKTDEVASIPVQRVAAPRCHLYLWATCPLLPDALQVMATWGFRWATIAYIWVKANSGAWEEAKEHLWQMDLFATDTDALTQSLLERVAFFGPGFYTGSNVELVLLGTKGQPFRHAKGRKASQLIFAPLDEHSRKPEAAQDRTEWMYPQCIRRLELFGRRRRAGWTVAGNEEIFPMCTNSMVDSEEEHVVKLSQHCKTGGTHGEERATEFSPRRLRDHFQEGLSASS